LSASLVESDCPQPLSQDSLEEFVDESQQYHMLKVIAVVSSNSIILFLMTLFDVAPLPRDTTSRVLTTNHLAESLIILPSSG
jgi:hypothetical protein